jgi:hypothetical protein
LRYVSWPEDHKPTFIHGYFIWQIVCDKLVRSKYFLYWYGTVCKIWFAVEKFSRPCDSCERNKVGLCYLMFVPHRWHWYFCRFGAISSYHQSSTKEWNLHHWSTFSLWKYFLIEYVKKQKISLKYSDDNKTWLGFSSRTMQYLTDYPCSYEQDILIILFKHITRNYHWVTILSAILRTDDTNKNRCMDWYMFPDIFTW